MLLEKLFLGVMLLEKLFLGVTQVFQTYGFAQVLLLAILVSVLRPLCARFVNASVRTSLKLLSKVEGKKEKAIGEPKKPEAIGEPKKPEAIGEPKKPKAIGEPKKPEAIGEPKKPEAIGEPKKPSGAERQKKPAREMTFEEIRAATRGDSSFYPRRNKDGGYRGW